MASATEQEALFRAFFREQETVAAGVSGTVLDARGSRGFVAILNGATATAQPSDAAGTVVPGSAAVALVDGALNEPNWSHYKGLSGMTCGNHSSEGGAS